MDQRTDEWYSARLGKVTASRVADVIAKTKSGYSASRENYMAQLICERMTGKPTETFTNAAMEWGTATEPLARAAYEQVKDCLVTEVGLIDHPFIKMSGASPDGVIGEGILEIKAPQTNTHFNTILSGEIPTKYQTQMFWQMSCTGALWGDFVSFDPRAPEGLQLFIKRLDRDQQQIDFLEKEVVLFLDELEIKIDSLNQLKGKYAV